MVSEIMNTPEKEGILDTIVKELIISLEKDILEDSDSNIFKHG